MNIKKTLRDLSTAYYRRTYQNRVFPRNMKWFFKNIWLFRKTLWYNRTWDYSGMLQAMDDHLSGQIKYGMPHILNGEKHIKNMKIARELIRRINNDDYTHDKVRISDFIVRCDEPTGGQTWNIRSEKIHDLPTVKLAYKTNYIKQDMEMLTNILRRHMLSWWD